MQFSLRLAALCSLLLLALSCGTQEDSSISADSVAEDPRAVFLLDQAWVREQEAPWSDVIEKHRVGPILWIAGGPIAEDRWHPVDGRPDLEEVDLRLRAPLEGGPFVHALAPILDRTGWRPAAVNQVEPKAGEYLMGKNKLLRRTSDPRASVTICYPTAAKRLVDTFSTASEERLGPGQVRIAGTTKRAALAPAPLHLIYQVEVPQSATLEFGYAQMKACFADRPGGLAICPLGDKSVQLRLRAERENGEQVLLWEHELLPEEAMRFGDVKLDLAEFEKQLIRLHFEAQPAEEVILRGEHPLLAWVEPVIFTSERDERPNVLVILLDTLRADRLGCYGNERGLTPVLDELASRGVRFADSMSAASWTLPSHASLFTSTYPSQHGVWSDQVLPKSLPTIAELLRDAGYRTAAFTEGGFMNTAHGFERGHSTHDSRVRDSSETYALAKEWIATRTTPYYAFVHTYQVHSPHDPAKEFRERFVRPYDGDLPEVVDSPTYQWGRRTPLPTGADAQYVSDLYDAEVAYVDGQVGKLLGELEESGALENTLIIVTSDHGEEFFEHGGATHGFSLYQEQLHVPLILHWPGHFEGGRVIDSPVHSVDIAPTIASAAGLSLPESFVGVPLSLDPSPSARPLFVPMKTYFRSKPERSGEEAMSLRQGHMKYISFPSDMRPQDEHPDALLFDLAADPGEHSNLLDAEGQQLWQGRLDELYERFSPVGTAEVAEYDEATQAELQKLGYTGD